MYSGYLDKQVDVTKIERVFDGRGGYTNREVFLGSFWAAMMPMGISERSQYMAMDVDVDVNVYMRFNPDITRGSRLTYRGNTYEVQGVINPAFQDVYMRLVVSEV